VPYTLKHTTLAETKTGMRVNIEVDVLARYIVRALESGLISTAHSQSGITEEFLREHGFG
jgi:riboflavin synthase